ncbi:hypothetical protein QE152_g23098 [Popillia japonica]|uniref:Uncharacterized protein n=1 Tax=Popillia japonica TaxID=7064 RepID=A0AAW1KJ29_POPJA
MQNETSPKEWPLPGQNSQKYDKILDRLARRKQGVMTPVNHRCVWQYDTPAHDPEKEDQIGLKTHRLRRQPIFIKQGKFASKFNDVCDEVGRIYSM